MSVDIGPAITTLAGGVAAALGGWVAAMASQKSARKLAQDQREADASDLRARHRSDLLDELQLATLHLERALVWYAGVRTAELERDDEPVEGEIDWSSGRALVDAMAVVQIVASRLGDEPAAGPAMVLHACASNMLSLPHDPRVFPRMVDQISHQLDEGLAHGEEAIKRASEALATLPPPSTYRPLAPWDVRLPPEAR